MPDIRLADGLLDAARELVSGNTKKVRQANLRRAVSSCYYAVFHALAKQCADALVGKTKTKRPNKAWVEVYRGLDHSTCKSACDNASKVAFPQDIHDFSDAFKQLQEARHSADYDPMVRLSKLEAEIYIGLATDAIIALRRASANDSKAFAAWVLITSRGAKDARKRAQAGNIRAVAAAP